MKTHTKGHATATNRYESDLSNEVLWSLAEITSLQTLQRSGMDPGPQSILAESDQAILMIFYCEL